MNNSLLRPRGNSGSSRAAEGSAPAPAPLPPSRLDALGRLVAGRRTKWAVLVLWFLLMSFAGSLAGQLGSVQNNEASTWLPNNAESTRALQIQQREFTEADRSTAVVVYARTTGLTAADKAKIEADRSGLAAHAVAPVGPVQYSADGQAALLSLPVPTSPSDNGVLGKAVDAIAGTARHGDPAGLEVGVTGPAGNVDDYIKIFSGMDTTLLGVTLGVVTLLLLLTYRSPVLWLVPLLSVGMADGVASGAVYLLAKHAGVTVNGESANVLTVLVLGVGTDYALLLIARYREELRRVPDRHQAMARALRRCLPAVTASAGTVVVATLCLGFGEMNSTRGLGPVAAVGVAVAFLTMTTLLPALLVIVGRWSFWPFVPRVSPEGADVERPRLWDRVAAFTGRAPRILWASAAAGLVLLAFAAPMLRTGQTQADQFTRRTDSVVGQQLVARHFAAGTSAPADVYTPTADADRVAAAARAVPGVQAVSQVATAGGWTHLAAVLADPPDTGAARQTVTRLRHALLPLQSPDAGQRTVVGGQSAVALDTSAAETGEEELLIPVILLVVFLMLVVLLRAVVGPVLLLAGVVLSYTAALGAAALLFRAVGHPRIDPSLILFGFLFLVALGVDYTVFLMTRVREEVQLRGHREGTLTGLAATGGVITSAGVILAASFAVLAVLPVVASLQQGLLIATGILLDTFVVRSLLVPALTLDVGRRVWWPSRLAAR